MSQPHSTLPPEVAGAEALAAQHGFDRSSQREVGRLLHSLAAEVEAGVIGEIGTGYGVGTAWLAAGLDPARQLVTVEADPARAAAVRALFAASPNVRVLTGDWRAILEHGPFALLFVDAAPAKQAPEDILAALAPGGQVVLDDLTPLALWPPEWRGQPDPVREFWLKDPRVRGTEVRISPTAAVIVATRVA